MRLLVDPPGYRILLLRFWEERGRDAGSWRFTVEDPQTGERHGFGDFDLLVAWLRSETVGAVDEPLSGMPAPGAREEE